MLPLMFTRDEGGVLSLSMLRAMLLSMKFRGRLDRTTVVSCTLLLAVAAVSIFTIKVYSAQSYNPHKSSVSNPLSCQTGLLGHSKHYWPCVVGRHLSDLWEYRVCSCLLGQFA
jgi:hypothetical protein